MTRAGRRITTRGTPRSGARAALAGITTLAALAACSAPPDLSSTEAAFRQGAGGPEAAQARVSSEVAQTGFGAQIAAAVENYPGLAASNARIRAAQAERESEAGAFLPQVSLGVEAGTRRAGGGRVSQATPLVEVSQLVYDGGQSTSRERAARARVFQSRGERLESVSQTALDAVTTYHELLSRRRLLALAEDNLDVHRTFMRQIEERAEAGAGSRTDMLTARARLADAESRRVAAQSQLDRSRARFREFFGRAPTALPEPQPAPALPGETAEGIIAQSPRMRGIEASLKAAQADLAAAEAAHFPSVSVGATGERLRGGGSDVSLNLSLDYDLATRGQRDAAIKAAQARVETLRADRDALTREIRRALEFVRSDQEAGAARLRAAREAAAANKATVDAAREQFSIGRRSLVDLLDAQRDYLNAAEAEIRARRERAVTDYAALALTGDILDVFDITLPPLDPET